MLRVLISIAAYISALIVISGISFVVVIVLAGPHAGLLPRWLEAVVLFLGWAVVL